MPLSSVVTMVADRLAAAGIPGLPPVDALAPGAPGDVPRITVSIEGAVPAVRGLGEVPGPPQTGALRVETSVDLADPRIHPGGETVELLSGDRRTLQLPHGAVVRADGTDTPPYATADLTVRLGATTFTPVTAGAPSATQVLLDVGSGELRFADPLPATGSVLLGYFVGLWEITVERFAAAMYLDIAHAVPAEHAALTVAVEAALGREHWPATAGMRQIQPVALSAATPIAGLPAGTRTRRLTYAIDVERITPVIRTSGGPIAAVAVEHVRLDAPPDGLVELPAEAFTVGSEPAP